jgi:DNA polymerase-3 subunit chi
VLPTLLEEIARACWRVWCRLLLEERVEALDSHLWTFTDDSFLPPAPGAIRRPEPADPITIHPDNPNSATVASH